MNKKDKKKIKDVKKDYAISHCGNKKHRKIIKTQKVFDIKDMQNKLKKSGFNVVKDLTYFGFDGIQYYITKMKPKFILNFIIVVCVVILCFKLFIWNVYFKTK